MQKKIVGIGANVYDTLYTLNDFPKEDTKMRAEFVTESGGGPCTTGLVAAKKLGAECAYIGVLANDEAGKFLVNDMEKYGIKTDYIDILNNYSSFSSVIWLNKKTSSRTCVFFKGSLPSLVLDDKKKQAISEADILMVDGNELDAAVKAAKIAKKFGTKVLYDAGGMYKGVERLLPLADILIPSEEFALSFTKEKNAEEAAKKLYEKFGAEAVIVTQGKSGGILYDGKETFSYNAFSVKTVDSNGAGDVFHGAFAFSYLMWYNYKKSCIFSSAVSALKCMKTGARQGTPDFDQTMKFLKENKIYDFEENME